MSTDAQPAESSPATTSAPAPISGQALIDSFTPDEHAKWEMDGVLPDRVTVKTSDAKPDSSPATPEQAASTEVIDKPASEPGKPKGDKLKARNVELDKENEELREKLRIRHALREELARTERPPDAKPSESSTEKPTQSEWQRYKALPGAPKEEDFDTYADFTAAQSLFITDQRWDEHQSRARERGQAQQQQEAVERVSQEASARVLKYAEANPGFETRVDPRILEVKTVAQLGPKDRIGPHNVLAEEIAKSPVTPQLLEHFSTDDGRKDWSRLCALPPTDLLRAFGRLEARFEAGAPAAAPTKTLSTAPNPATVLGARPADTADPIETAVREKDQERYEREANKRELAALRR